MKTAKIVNRLPGGDVVLDVRCKPFAGISVAEHRVMVKADGSVLVWSTRLERWTARHDLHETTRARLRLVARD